eukprot:gene5281-47867_t
MAPKAKAKAARVVVRQVRLGGHKPGRDLGLRLKGMASPLVSLIGDEGVALCGVSPQVEVLSIHELLHGTSAQRVELYGGNDLNPGLPDHDLLQAVLGNPAVQTLSVPRPLLDGPAAQLFADACAEAGGGVAVRALEIGTAAWYYADPDGSH